MDFVQNYIHSAVPFSKPMSTSILKEFQSFYKWDTCDDEDKSALDIGCGEGTVTTEVIKHFLPETVRLDGADKSEDMIRFAKNCFEKEGFTFFLMDLEEDALDKSLVNSYNYVFSMFCFQFIGKQRQALKNVYDVLKPNGKFIFAFMSNLPYFKALKTLSANPKWSSYMEDIDKMCPLPFANEKFPHKVFAELMSECGFRNVITKVDVKRSLFDSFEVLVAQARYVEPFRKRMPLELQEEYFAAFLDTVKQTEGFWTKKYNAKAELDGVVEAFELLIGYGEK